MMPYVAMAYFLAYFPAYCGPVASWLIVYKLTESQLEPINSLIKKVEEQEKEKQKEFKQREQEQKEYQNLLNKLIQKQEPITELNILNHLFKDLNITDDTQSRILIGLMKYNKRISK